MENNTNPREESRTEKVVDAVIAFVLFLSGLTALYSLIWANWPVFKLSVTICVTVLIGTAFGYFMANYFSEKFKK